MADMRIVHPPGRRGGNKDECGAGCWHPLCCQRYANVKVFVGLMCAVIAVQGTYLGYTVGSLTSLERRFELSSSGSGLLLAMYDVGNTVATLFVGYCGAHRHKPRWTAVGVLLSALAMFGLVLPIALFGIKYEAQTLADYRHDVEHFKCHPKRLIDWDIDRGYEPPHCNRKTNNAAFAVLIIAQILAGVAAAPFNTLAYVYIDDNVHHQSSPMYLGLLTSMYAFGPAIGFGLSSICNTIYVLPGKAPIGQTPTHPSWVGAWWLGYLLCSVLYLLLSVPLFMFPRSLRRKRSPQRPVSSTSQRYNPQEMELMNVNGETDKQSTESSAGPGCMDSLVVATKNMPSEIWRLLHNPVFVAMMVGWIFGSYLVGGYGTYLPKYIEIQYQQSAAAADLYAGLISIGAVALSTAVGGYLLTRFNMTPQQSIVALLCSWSVILVTYLLGTATGCAHPQLQNAHQIDRHTWNFTSLCNQACQCGNVVEFEPICVDGLTFFSPCHAGCSYNYREEKWTDCRCALSRGPAELGVCSAHCWQLGLYVPIMFVGLFLGNMFFMTTMMVVLRSVDDEQKSLALSFASCITNVFSFIPAPIIFGAIIDASCAVWHSVCPGQLGNCIAYNNGTFRLAYHLGNAGLQLCAVLAVAATYWLARRFSWPEELADSEFDDDDQPPDERPAL